MRFQLFFLVVFIALRGAGQGVFEPMDRVYVKESSAQKKFSPVPDIKYNFKEVRDSLLLIESKKKISSYTKYKVAPYNFEGMYFVNPSLQSDTIISSLKKNLNIEALRYYVDSSSFTFDKKKGVAAVNTIIPLDKIFQPFYFKETEVTNEEYREFVLFVRDSIARKLLFENYSGHEADFGYYKNDTFFLKRDKPVPWNSNDQEIKECLQPLYIPVYQRYYNRREIDTRKLNWQYYFQATKEDAEKSARRSFDNNTIREQNPDIKTWEELFRTYKKDFELQKDIINTYPDTLCWVHDFAISEFESFTNLYIWHPAYNTHPVVGVTYLQARAFLIWKTQRLQEELNRKKIKIKVECDFPTAIEWEMVTSAAKHNGEWNYFSAACKTGFMPNLQYEKPPEILRDSVPGAKVKPGSGVISFSETQNDSTVAKLFYDFPIESKSLRDQLLQNFENLNKFVFPTTYTDDKFKARKDPSDEKSQQYFSIMKRKDFVSFLNGNVSEWMSERFSSDFDFSDKYSWYDYHPNSTKWSWEYQGNYEPVFSLYLKILGNYSGADTKEYIGKLKENFRQKTKTARLAQGANFYDMGDIINGANKFTFVSEDSAHAAIGFRYVIRFKEK